MHPAVPEAYLNGTLAGTLSPPAEEELREHLPGLRAEEAVVLVLLQQRLSSEANERAA